MDRYQSSPNERADPRVMRFPKNFLYISFYFSFFFVEEEEEEVSTDRQHHLLYLYIRKKNKTTNVIGKVSTI